MKPVIELKDVHKTYYLGEVPVRALRGMSLKIKQGDFISVMGPSGSGKSTALNMIGALDIPTKGSILLDGQDISNLSENDLAQLRGRKIGFIFQQFNLIKNLTAKENVMLPMVFQNVPEVERIKRAEELLARMGLEDRMDHKPNEMSGGEQQRVAIARSLVNEPEIVLADEPTGNLDSKTGKDVMKQLIGLNKEGKTLVVVTHDKNVAKYAGRIVKLKDGRISK